MSLEMNSRNSSRRETYIKTLIPYPKNHFYLKIDYKIIGNTKNGSEVLTQYF